MNLASIPPNVMLARLSRRIGWRIPTWVQGAGGNVSLKYEANGRQHLLVKASGVRLDQLTPLRGFAAVDTELFRSKFDLAKEHLKTLGQKEAESKYARAISESQISYGENPTNDRPSMETGLHLAMPSPVVAHFHSLPAILMAHHVETDQTLKPWLERQIGGKLNVLPALMPGRELSLEVFSHRDAKVLLLANHGVILAINDARDIALWEAVERRFLQNYRYTDLLSSWAGGHRANLNAETRNVPIPLRFYLPDTAVFANEIQRSLISKQISGGEKCFVLNSERQDLIEIWSAQQMLYAACPSLATLPDRVVDRIRGLPTEKYRLKKSAS